MSKTINNGIPFVPENTIDPAAGLNLSLNDIDALLQLRVVTFGLTMPPAGVEGERHIVGVGATGDWAGQDNKMARYLDSAWHFYDAYYCAYDGALWTFDGSGWFEAGSAGALNDLADVTITTPSDGEGLVYNGSVWVTRGVLKPSGDTITDITITRYAETIAAATTTIDRADGGIQTLTLTADSALTWALNNGEKIHLYLTPSGFSVTDWGVTHWMTDVPTLATENMIVVEKVSGNIYARDGGSR